MDCPEAADGKDPWCVVDGRRNPDPVEMGLYARSRRRTGSSHVPPDVVERLDIAAPPMILVERRDGIPLDGRIEL